MKHTWLTLLATAAFWLLQSAPVQAENSSRLIPFGKVSIIEDGKEATRHHSEVPLPEGATMLCSGSCVVQSRGLQLTVRDKTLFSANETANGWNITVHEGKIDFGLGAAARPVTLHTPQDAVAIHRVGAMGAGASVVRGSAEVSGEGTMLAVARGALNVTAGSGERTLEAGESMFLESTLQAGAPPGPASKGTGVANAAAKHVGPGTAGQSRTTATAASAGKETGATAGSSAAGGVPTRMIDAVLVGVAAGGGAVAGTTTLQTRKSGLVSGY